MDMEFLYGIVGFLLVYFIGYVFIGSVQGSFISMNFINWCKRTIGFDSRDYKQETLTQFFWVFAGAGLLYAIYLWAQSSTEVAWGGLAGIIGIFLTGGAARTRGEATETVLKVYALKLEHLNLRFANDEQMLKRFRRSITVVRIWVSILAFAIYGVLGVAFYLATRVDHGNNTTNTNTSQQTQSERYPVSIDGVSVKWSCENSGDIETREEGEEQAHAITKGYTCLGNRTDFQSVKFGKTDFTENGQPWQISEMSETQQINLMKNIHARMFDSATMTNNGTNEQMFSNIPMIASNFSTTQDGHTGYLRVLTWIKNNALYQLIGAGTDESAVQKGVDEIAGTVE